VIELGAVANDTRRWRRLPHADSITASQPAVRGSLMHFSQAARTSAMERHAVLALYRPQPGQTTELREMVARHAPLLRKLELLTDTPAVVMQTDAGTCIEIFRWRSPEAARAADENPEVRRLRQEISRISDTPPIDANAAAVTDGPRLLPVILLPRSSEAELESRPQLGRIARIVGVLALVPVVGAPLALVALVWGLVTNKRGASRLIGFGLGGIAISIGAAIVFMAIRNYNLPFGPMMRMLAQQELTETVRSVEFHKIQTGHYPDTLVDLRESSPPGTVAHMFDPSQSFMAKPRMFYYERIDADHYYLLGVGPDSQPFTADDLVPQIDVKPGSHVGLVVKR
jgi:hypothetical protein